MAERLEAPSQNLNAQLALEAELTMRREGADSIKARGESKPRKDAGYTRAAKPTRLPRKISLTQRRDHILGMTVRALGMTTSDH